MVLRDICERQYYFRMVYDKQIPVSWYQLFWTGKTYWKAVALRVNSIIYKKDALKRQIFKTYLLQFMKWWERILIFFKKSL